MDSGMGTESKTKGRRRMAIMAAPFVPVVLALAVALGIRYWPKAEVGGLGAGDARGKKAPEFVLPDAQEKEDVPPVRLSKLVEKGPVVVTFIPTFGCKRCLMYLEEMAARSAELKAAGLEQIVVISPWTYENLRQTLEGMESVPFPVLSDFEEDHYGDTAAAFGMEDEGGFFPYGTFVIDQNMRVAFSDKADEPFTDWARLVEVGKGMRKAR
jgi:peroxiredoxin